MNDSDHCEWCGEEICDDPIQCRRAIASMERERAQDEYERDIAEVNERHGRY